MQKMLQRIINLCFKPPRVRHNTDTYDPYAMTYRQDHPSNNTPVMKKSASCDEIARIRRKLAEHDVVDVRIVAQ